MLRGAGSLSARLLPRDELRVVSEEEGAVELPRDGAVERLEGAGAGEDDREGCEEARGAGVGLLLRDGAGAGAWRELPEMRGVLGALEPREGATEPPEEPPEEPREGATEPPEDPRELPEDPPEEPPDWPRVDRCASTVRGAANSVNAATIRPVNTALRGVNITCLRQRPGARSSERPPERKKGPPPANLPARGPFASKYRANRHKGKHIPCKCAAQKSGAGSALRFSSGLLPLPSVIGHSGRAFRMRFP